MTELGWNGEPLRSPMAFDFETDVVDLRVSIPQPVVLSAYDGERSLLLAPHQLDAFTEAHQGHVWLGFNSAFDWWVNYQALGKAARRLWIKVVDEGRLRDGMLLDMLIRLADGRDDNFFRRSLKVLVKEYLGVELTKDHDVRTGFGEFIGKPLSEIPLGSREYAAEDAIQTYRLYTAQEAICCSLQPRGVPQERFGWLSETIQVKASIALAQMTRNGMAVDRQTVTSKANEYRETTSRAMIELERFDPTIIKRFKKGERQGEPQLTKTGQPQLNTAKLRELIAETAKRHMIWLPKTPKTGEIQVSGDLIREHQELIEVPAIKAWVDYQEAVKTLQFLVALEDRDEVHPSYDVLKRTGRTSASDPNIQQMPRDPWFRAMFRARSGHRLITVDYAFIELRTLAADIEASGKPSTLGKVIRQGIDPHAWTASIVLGQPLEKFLASKQLDPKHFKAQRQAAKAVNFGIPGGLRPRKLVTYARHNYGVELTLAEATTLWNRLVHDVYPELVDWLEDSLESRLSATLGVSRKEVLRVFGRSDQEFLRPEWSPVARLVRGETHTKSNEPWSPYFVEDTWNALDGLAARCDLSLRKKIRAREAGQELYERLFVSPSVTLTGRIRKKVGYGEYRNTKFQGLASDGAKLALWELLKLELANPGEYRQVAFAHDEAVVEVPYESAERLQSDTETIMGLMVRGMSDAIQSDLPIGCEAAVGECWIKG